MSFFRVERGGGFAATVDARAVGRALGAYPELFAHEARRAFVRGGVHWERDMKQSFVGFGQGSRTSVQNRSGNLRRSVQYRVNGNTLNKLALQLQIGDNRAPYAMTQERGAVIRPRNSRYLTVPLDDALTPSGVVRGDALIRKAGDGHYTDRGKTRILEANNKLFVVDGTGGQLRFLYILKDQVVIPGPDSTGGPSRLGGERRARAMVNDKLGREITEAARRAWARGRPR